MSASERGDGQSVSREISRLRARLERLAEEHAATISRKTLVINDQEHVIIGLEAERDRLRVALDDLLDWAENIEGEGRLRRTEVLAQAREALNGGEG